MQNLQIRQDSKAKERKEKTKTGESMKLIYSKTKKEVQVGDRVPNFRGELVEVTGFGYPPQHSSTSGRVELDGRLYFPGVIGAEWVSEDDE